MKINELLEQYDIDDIQKATRITKENLKKIIARDFENLNKTQVFGFLSIMEREYGPIEDLREDANEYFANIKESEKLTLSIKPNPSLSINLKPKKIFDLQLILFIFGILAIVFVGFKAFNTNLKDNIQAPKMIFNLNEINTTIELSNTTNINALSKKDLNDTNATSIDQNITVVPKKESRRKIVKNHIIDGSHSADKNQSATIAKIKPKYNNQKKEYLKAEDSNKSQKNNF